MKTQITFDENIKNHISTAFQNTILENQWLINKLPHFTCCLYQSNGETLAEFGQLSSSTSDILHTKETEIGHQLLLRLTYPLNYKTLANDILQIIKHSLDLKIKYKLTQTFSVEDAMRYIMSELNKNNKTKDILAYFLDYLLQMLPCRSLSIFFWNKEQEQYIHEVSTNQQLTYRLMDAHFSSISLEHISSEHRLFPIKKIPQLTGLHYLFIGELEELYLFPLKKGETPYAVLIIECQDINQFTSEITQDLSTVSDYIGRALYEHFIWRQMSKKMEQYRILYQVTEKFHSSMDVRDVLRGIMEALQQLYPTFDCHLLLTDNDHYKNLPVKQLDLSIYENNIPMAEAFLKGQIKVKRDTERQLSYIYAPLNGRQGTYGVLEVEATGIYAFMKNDTELIKLLANTAGNALENAKLYQQSQRFVSDLKLINRASHQLNSNLRLKDIIAYMKGQIIETFHADEVGFFIFKPSFSILPGSSSFFLDESLSDAFLKKLIKQILNGKDSLFSGDLRRENKDPSFPYQSLMAVPMTQDHQTVGMIVALHRNAYAFTFDAFKLLESIVYHSSLAFMNSMLREELEQLVNTDHLTQLYTRKYLDSHIQTSLLNDRYGLFILFDIDDFKKVNDTYGHQIGDQVLVQVANVLKNQLRECDVAARWGGEELAIYIPNVVLNTGLQISQRLIAKIREMTEPRVTVSCGVAYWNKDKQLTVESLFKEADRSLYKAKALGKNQVVY